MRESEYETRAVDSPDEPVTARGVTRRLFLKRSTTAVASAGAATVGTMAVTQRYPASAQDATPTAGHDHNATGTVEPEDRPIAFFNIHEAETVDAIVSRIL